MRKINLHNYEAFLLDYLDGNLNETDLQELKTFALLNSQLDIDLSNDSLPFFNSENEIFLNKFELKKTSEDIYNEDVLNYIEGNLSEQEKINFELLLSLNPKLKREVEAYKKTDLKIVADGLKFNSLYLLKTEDDLILNNFAINYIENNLSVSEKTHFENELKTNLVLQKEVKRLQQTKLIVDLYSIYPNKEELKKEAKVITLFNFRTVSAMAAGLLLLISLSFVLNYYVNSKEKVEGKIALQLKNKTNFSILKKQSTNSVIANSLINNSSNNLIAKNNRHSKPFDFSQGKLNRKNFLKIKSIIYNNNTKYIALNNVVKKDTTLSTPINTTLDIAIQTNSLNPTITNTINAVTTQTILLVYEEDVEEYPQTAVPQKNNFWKRAVKVAKQLNGLGLKAIKGDEKPNNDYVLGFNSVSVEKK